MGAKKKKEPVPNRLEEIRIANGENMTEAAKRCGLPYTTYISYEKRQREMDSEVLIQLSQALGITIDHLLYRGGNVVRFKPPLVQKYERLDETAKRVVDSVMEIESERTAEKPAAESTKIIPLFTSAFAAGPSGDFAEEAWEDYEVPADTKADFAIRVSGDSMEPELHDGEIYLCKKRYPEIGEIAVAVVNGEFYVKQFITDGKNIFLRSVNRARKDNDIDIWRSGQYTGRCLGTVIHKRIPLVEQ